MPVRSVAARKIRWKGSWHLRLAHQTTSYDKVYLRSSLCRHRGLVGSMTAVDTNNIRPHSFGISSLGVTSFLETKCRRFNAMRTWRIGQLSSLEQLVCDVHEDDDQKQWPDIVFGLQEPHGDLDLMLRDLDISY
ncbi:hypothetical protein HBH98_202310 [Parastagonospora nodorum]|nr:hypothetical protein HBH50_142570 [Parastagonospora nodorum]KAH4086186.1 hypothetical protein HBH48_147420 [Parastagonospora nodorum]KAH4105414.1 hypothetical protein HBH46_087100 [Parastagonospora nodorum]KAH4208849.1 hypothetical protein HBI95_096160 [Parastagonospora nodorum]KAH4339662.1 hypothetical protein HBH98_202310 [Parastagonospora nodorum]